MYMVSRFAGVIIHNIDPQCFLPFNSTKMSVLALSLDTLGIMAEEGLERGRNPSANLRQKIPLRSCLGNK